MKDVRVRTEASTPGGGRGIAIELDDSDGRQEFPGWDDMSTNDRFRKLSAKADSLAVFYMAREHMMTPEQARARMAVLRQAMA